MANLNLGERGHRPSLTLTHTSDGTGVPGDAMTWDAATGKVTVATSGDFIYGVLRDRETAVDGEYVSIGVVGTFKANLDGAAVLGDPLEVAATNGQMALDPARDDADATNDPSYRASVTENSAGDLLVLLR